MLKVLYLRSSFDPGGTESLLLNLYNYQQNEIQFHYIFLKDGSLINRLNSESNKYYKVFRRKRLDYVVLGKITDIIKENHINIVHTHQMLELLYAVLLRIRYPKLKFFHTIHGYFGKRNRWAPLLEKLLIRFTVKTFTVSHATRDILKQKGYPIKRIEIIYNAVNFPLKANKSEMQIFKKRINYKQGDFLAGMTGSFVWQKDQCTIVKAYNLIKDEIPALKIIFIGKESDLSEKCKELLDENDIDKHIFFLGTLENAGKYLPGFDLFIMSTLMDTFGIVVIEALMQKVPVLASDIEVMKELSHNGKYFDLFKKQDPASLAQAIIKHFQRKNDKKIKEAYEYARNTYSYDNYCDKLVKRYSI